MGYIGAGAEIMPEFEQTPPDGLEQIKTPFPLPPGLIAFKVRGESMLPRYDDGDVVIVWAEQKRAIEAFYGQEAAVRTSDGRRFLKNIMRSNEGVSLHSWNAKPIENVFLEWIGEIYGTIRATQFSR
jgi:repressor LexA